MRPYWDRIFAVSLIILSPLIIKWLRHKLPILDHYPGLEPLLLWGIILVGIALIIKTLKA